MEVDYLAQLASALLERLDVGWTFLLLLTRFALFIMVVPGLGGGMGGLAVRYPAVVALSVASLDIRHPVPVPSNAGDMVLAFGSELALGGLLGLIPLLIIAGAQTAGQVASGTMGLNGAQLFDPTTATSLPDLSRLYSDLSIVIFLSVGGYYPVIAVLAGMDGVAPPGSFIVQAKTVAELIQQSSHIFEIGCVLAAPVIVALLLTNFVLAIVSKTIPTVNLFVISAPFTIGIGLIISMLALPEVAHALARHFLGIEGILSRLL
jgi:flagellar biosynthetic protein FliR